MHSHKIKAWVDGVPFEAAAREQVERIAAMPFIHRHVAVMPDVHLGKGATVGSVIPTIGAIIPAAVGVDIGCGMSAVRTTLTASDLPDNLHGIRSAIEAAVPHGRTDSGGRNDKGAHPCEVPHAVSTRWGGLERYYRSLVARHGGLEHPAVTRQLGTLGTGNHFIEICLDEADMVWVMLHSGSRGAGNRIGTYFIELAKKDMRRWFINLPDADLAYIPEGSEHFQEYTGALLWAQAYARLNRDLMMGAVLGAMRLARLPVHADGVTAVDCHHNYVAKEHHFGRNAWITRKGAVRARKGDMGIIPGSMGAKSYIVRGLGSPDSFHSCSHGAGRVMSRAEARRRVSLEEHAQATAGVECRKDLEVIDETPAAYKSIDAVMEAQKDLVEVVHTLRQVVCIKG